MTEARFDPPVDSLLREAGWRPGRNVAETVARWESALDEDGFTLHAVAKNILLEFGGLHVGRSARGVDRARADIRFDPTLAIGQRDDLESFTELRGRSVYPLGEVDGGHGFLVVADDGRAFLVMDEIYDRWTTFDAALRGLLLGLRSPAV
ncbi:MAG TPA: SUKH-3 domain-containing protein [Gemmatimonadaceae bacterium]|jgi:hypothetical protein